MALIKALDLNPIITMDAKAYKVATGTDTPEADKFTVVPLDPFVFKTPSTHKAYQFVIEHSTKGDYTAKHKDSNKYLYGNSPDDGVWYLTNFKETEPPKEPEPKPVKPTPTPEPDPGKPTPDNPKPDPGKPAPVNPEPNTPKPGTTVVTPAVAAHATLPQIGLENLYQMRDTLYQRLGDVSLANASHNGAWVRLTGLHAELKDNFGFKADGQRFEFGLDRTFDRVAQGRVLVGASVLALQSKNDINLGKFKDRSLAGSLYATYLNDNGWYVDTVGRFGRTKAYDFNVTQKGSEITADPAVADKVFEGHIANTSASVTTLSMEAGKRFALQHHFYVKPQAQLQYGHLGTRHGQYAIGAFKYDVTWDAMNSLLGRAGLELGWDWSDAARHPGSVHIVGNVLREMSAKGKLHMHNSALDNTNDDASLTRDYKRTWYTLGVGANVKLNNAWLLHGNVERTFKGLYNDLWRVDLGVRYQF